MDKTEEASTGSGFIQSSEVSTLMEETSGNPAGVSFTDDVSGSSMDGKSVRNIDAEESKPLQVDLLRLLLNTKGDDQLANQMKELFQRLCQTVVVSSATDITKLAVMSSLLLTMDADTANYVQPASSSRALNQTELVECAKGLEKIKDSVDGLLQKIETLSMDRQQGAIPKEIQTNKPESLPCAGGKDNSGQLKVFYQNCRSITNKKSALKKLVDKDYFDVIIVCESWLKKDDKLSSNILENYNELRERRKFKPKSTQKAKTKGRPNKGADESQEAQTSNIGTPERNNENLERELFTDTPEENEDDDETQTPTGTPGKSGGDVTNEQQTPTGRSEEARGGGILVLIKKDHDYRKIDLALENSESRLEFLSFDLYVKKNMQQLTRVVAVYIPKSDKATVEHLCKVLKRLIKDLPRVTSDGEDIQSRMMVVGDFNMATLQRSLSEDGGSTGNVLAFRKFVESSHLEQFCKFTTYRSYLDLCFSDQECQVEEYFDSPLKSDHVPMHISF